MPWTPQSRLIPRTLTDRIRQSARSLRPFIDRRMTGRRQRGHEIFSDLGKVVNLSPGGVRIRSIRRLHGTQTFELWARDVRVKVRAEIAWTRKTGFRRHEIGMRFVDLTTDDIVALTRLAQ
ncbi:MAG: PilZ domain-containing protein [Planctomycetes bacterium]|nr:PilZ domain-containing protein [Planctomycetota bacterium]